MIDVDKLIYNSFLKNFEGRKYGNVGVELEFPLVNSKNEPIAVSAARGVFDYFLKRGFKEDIKERGEVYFIVNSDGDCLSFDNSYNNFEFSLNYGDDLTKISERFYRLLDMAEEYFSSCGYTLAGRGTNPAKKYAPQLHVDFSTYNMVDEYLHKFGENSPYPDFPAYLSSAQTHLDVPLGDLPEAYTFFAKTDFVRGLLFANSPDFDGGDYRCFRDFLWEQSAFSRCPNITGKVDGKFSTADDIVKYIASKGMFNRVRNGKYEIFAPVCMREYFARPDAEEGDIENYLSFKNVEITRRGTLEIRSDCAQPFEEALLPAAFNLGLSANMEKADGEIELFFKENGIALPNSALREMAVKGVMPAAEGATKAFLQRMCSAAAEGLEARGRGEEKILAPIYDRI